MAEEGKCSSRFHLLPRGLRKKRPRDHENERLTCRIIVCFHRPVLSFLFLRWKWWSGNSIDVDMISQPDRTKGNRGCDHVDSCFIRKRRVYQTRQMKRKLVEPGLDNTCLFKRVWTWAHSPEETRELWAQPLCTFIVYRLIMIHHTIHRLRN